MAKDFSRYQEGIVKRYYEQHETIQSNKLSEIVSDLWLAADEKTRAKLWARVKTALLRVRVDESLVAKVVGQRDIESLAKLVTQVDAGAPPKQLPGGNQGRASSVSNCRTIGQMQREKAAESGYDSLEEANLKRALRAFRKKIKAIRLDDESRLGNRCTTSGRKSNIAAITPPNQYPKPVWDKLVELGRLKRSGQGVFELP